MSQTNEMATVLKELKDCADVIIRTIQWLEEAFTATDIVEEKQLTLEDVRAILADISRAGFTAQIRELLQKYDANRLSEVAPEHYPALLKDAEVLNAT